MSCAIRTAFASRGNARHACLRCFSTRDRTRAEVTRTVTHGMTRSPVQASTFGDSIGRSWDALHHRATARPRMVRSADRRCRGATAACAHGVRSSAFKRRAASRHEQQNDSAEQSLHRAVFPVSSAPFDLYAGLRTSDSLKATMCFFSSSVAAVSRHICNTSRQVSECPVLSPR